LQTVLALTHESHDENEVARHQPHELGGHVVRLAWPGKAGAVIVAWHRLSRHCLPSEIGHQIEIDIK